MQILGNTFVSINGLNILNHAACPYSTVELIGNLSKVYPQIFHLQALILVDLQAEPYFIGLIQRSQIGNLTELAVCPQCAGNDSRCIPRLHIIHIQSLAIRCFVGVIGFNRCPVGFPLKFFCLRIPGRNLQTDVRCIICAQPELGAFIRFQPCIACNGRCN